MSLKTFTNSYIDTMLWAEMDDSGRPMDETYDYTDIAVESRLEIEKDCKNFYAEFSDSWDDDEGAGGDFYLTRNGHGAGFWDGDYPKDIGNILTDAAHVYGTQGLYEGDDGKLYVHG